MTQASSPRFPALNLSVAMMIAGTVGAFVTEAGLDPITTVFWRCAFGTVFLGAWCLLRGYLPDPGLSPARLARAALCGVCMVLSWTAFFAGFAKTSIAVMTIIYHIQPFFVVLIGVVFLKERVSADQVIWMVSAFVGVVLASGLVASNTVVTATWAFGILMALGGALLYAIVTVLAKGLGQQRPEITVLCQTVVGTIMLAPLANFSEHIPAASWGWLVGIGVLHTGIAYVMMFSAYPWLSTPVIGVLTFIYPVIAIIIDWAIYNHPIGLPQAIGMAMIAAATLGVRLGWRFPGRRASARLAPPAE
ncbi:MULTISPECIES: DMT family transporter [Phyllobacteriaceae]|jgi:drug/metabolite transporter (DMT)-like permease|uniref:Multidrug DMT transporter permease n=1 Tax=Mesorhizobium hungaricum TaxID=1566387 RepID=A0A1C2E8Y7_9HYPH|nr:MULTISPECIES: DMT family transporter [Mesorhizobium]MBN9236719.1 DMT family transporter [Mesorhizobium sp.]MDQ0329117.1 drug/metabolite transporter (DMT)-like permease [Mesorhizobium sp. YL-MeA3-2017]OCX23450.1 multidrug DMT transporter permease [Mesorhizobium hungaricum]